MNLRSAAALLLLGIAPVAAQTSFPVAPTGQNPGGTIRADAWYANTSSAGFGASSFSHLTATGTTQADAAVIGTTLTYLDACPTGAGVILPALERVTSVTIINRSGAACKVYPTLGTTTETALGTTGALNAPATINNNTDTTFRLISPTSWVQ